MKKICELFYVFNGSKLDFGKQIISESSDEKSINFISRSANNNGVAGRIILQDGMKTFNKGDITVPLGGSILSAFVQDEDFVTAQNVCVLRPIGEMSELEKWFYCYSIRENRFKFSAFGREVNKYIKEIELPENIPDWVYSSKGNIDFNLENQLSFPLNLKKDDWIDFYIHDVFTDIEPCKCSNASSLLIEGDDIEYIGAKKKNNGVMYKVQYNEDLITKGNCVIFICDGQGSVGYTNYIDHDFIGSTTLSVGRNDKLNQYSGIFLVTILDMERYRYSFGRKYKSNLRKAKIRLQAIYDSVSEKYVPDWQFMENYVKSLPFGNKI